MFTDALDINQRRDEHRMLGLPTRPSSFQCRLDEDIQSRDCAASCVEEEKTLEYVIEFFCEVV